MADWLRWYSPSEAQYKQEGITAVRARARRLCPIFTPLAQSSAVTEIEAKRTIAMLRPMISNSTARAFLSQELRALIGRRLTPKEAKLLACRVAGSFHDAARGIPLQLLSGEANAKECLGVVHNVTRGEDFQGEMIVELHVVISNGTFCADKVVLQFRLSAIQRWARWLGLTNRRSGFKIKNAMSFMDMQMICKVEREHGDTSCLGVTVTKAVESYNRSLTKRRSRLYQPCPFGAVHDCDMCPVGRNQCLRSMNRVISNFALKGSDSEQTAESSNRHASADAES